jgi:arginyl-tRNA synthetase
MKFTDFQSAYVETALWTSCDENGDTMDCYNASYIHPDTLKQMCKDCDADTEDKIQQLNQDLKTRCTNYYRAKLKELPITTPSKEIKTVIDRTFNLWDSFIKKALSSEDSKLLMLGILFQKYSYKDDFMSNKLASETYNKLK